MIFVSPEAESLRRRIDAVVFDMDGVLIDISRSIRPVNCLAPAYYLREVLGWKASAEIVTSAQIEAYKHAGGFNDDWDLTYALVLLYLVKAARYEDQNADADLLTPLSPTHSELAEAVATRGGGLNAAEDFLGEGVDRADQRVWKAYDKLIIRRCFQELLFGSLCRRIYGFDPELYDGPGFILQDRCLLDRRLLPASRKIGMQTGRTYEEAMIGRELCGLESVITEDVCVTKRDGYHKPEPGGLAILCERLCVETGGIYIGDTLDDLRTVRNLNALGVAPPFLAALVLTGPAGAANEPLFRAEGADLIGTDVNEVLTWISQ